MKQERFTLFYTGLCFLFIILDSLSLFIPSILVKALFMPSLIFFYHTQIRGNYNLMHRLIITGLGFSWLGDISLHFSNEQKDFLLNFDRYFIIGLIAFVITQIFYIVAFNLPNGRNTIFSSRLYQTLLVLAYGFLLIWYLYHSLGEMKIPVILYAVIILSMLLSALNRFGKVNGVSYMYVVIGAILFVLSDSMIAINKYYIKFDFARSLIMITYIAAQYLIVLGCIRQDNASSKLITE
jgi:uncharacterized membrane protein YhhN